MIIGAAGSLSYSLHTLVAAKWTELRIHQYFLVNSVAVDVVIIFQCDGVEVKTA